MIQDKVSCSSTFLLNYLLHSVRAVHLGVPMLENKSNQLVPTLYFMVDWLYGVLMALSTVFQSYRGGQSIYPCFPWFLLTLSQVTNFGLFQTDRVCRRQFEICWKWRKVLWIGRKHHGKRRNCLLRGISSFFNTVFSKDLYCRRIKTRICLGEG